MTHRDKRIATEDRPATDVQVGIAQAVRIVYYRGSVADLSA